MFQKKPQQRAGEYNPSQSLPASCDNRSTLHQPKQIKTKSSESKAVNFPGSPGGEKKHERFLTAKYGAHQMKMIRKRLKVEMWMFDQLQILCQAEVINYEKEVNN